MEALFNISVYLHFPVIGKVLEQLNLLLCQIQKAVDCNIFPFITNSMDC